MSCIKAAGGYCEVQTIWNAKTAKADKGLERYKSNAIEKQQKQGSARYNQCACKNNRRRNP